jgi:SsrA-binding protein
MAQENINIKNRRAGFEYEFIEKFVCGILLTGTEIKSIRQGDANISDAYCHFEASELFVQNMHISEYKQGNIYNHEPKRKRKLMLKRRELRKLEKKVKQKGLTIIPIRIFINNRGFAKLEIALAKGKKVHDKRESIKEKDVKRDMERQGIR